VPRAHATDFDPRDPRQCRFGAVPSIPARGARISSISRHETGPTRRMCTPDENWRM
jgi:hypothetical protein